MNSAEAKVREAAACALAYLAETDPLPTEPADAVIGFGMFDLKLPRFCGDLLARGLAGRIIFTGGIGAGTGNLGGPEATVWDQELARSHPEVPKSQIIIENQSTNTAENITFTAQLLERDLPEFAFGRGLRTAIVVASPSRLRRVRQTLRQLQPGLTVIRQLPQDITLAAEQRVYEQNGINYLTHLVGELDRLLTYPARGWIAGEPLPNRIANALVVLQEAIAK